MRDVQQSDIICEAQDMGSVLAMKTPVMHQCYSIGPNHSRAVTPVSQQSGMATTARRGKQMFTAAILNCGNAESLDSNKSYGDRHIHAAQTMASWAPKPMSGVVAGQQGYTGAPSDGRGQCSLSGYVSSCKPAHCHYHGTNLSWHSHIEKVQPKHAGH